MKTTPSNQTAVRDCKPEKEMLNQFSKNTSDSPFVTYSNRENMGSFKNMCELSSEKGNSINYHCGLSSAFGKLDLNDTKLQCVLNLDSVSDKANSNEDIKPQHLLPLDCMLDKNKSNEGTLVNINREGLAEDANIKSKCSMTVHNEETLGTVDLVNISTSVAPHIGSSRNAKCAMYEDDLAACFSEIGLSEKPHDVLSSATKFDSKKLGREKPSPESLSCVKIYGTPSQCANDLPLKIENNDLLSEQEIHGHFGITDSFAKTSLLNHFIVEKSESSPESELLHFDDDQSDEESLIERGAKKGLKDQREPKKLSRTMKVPKEESFKYLKHMSGGSVISASTNKPLNKTSAYCDLLSVDYSSDQSGHFKESSSQVLLPVYFDQNQICPVGQGCHSDAAYSFSTTYCDGDLLSDALTSSSTLNYSDSSSSSHQYTSTSDSLLDMYYPSPASEISNFNGQNSRSTTPESGYGSSPRFSYFSDDGIEVCKYKDQSYSNSSACLDNIRSLSPYIGSVQSNNESIDNTDFPFIDDNCSPTGPQHTEHTEEDRQRISVILQDLKKCEEYVRLNDTDRISNVTDVLSICPDQLDSQNTQQGFSCDTNASHLQGCSVPTDVTQQQEPSACVNVPLQQESAAVSSPQVILIYVPYAAKGMERGQKNLKPILPKLEGQPVHFLSAKMRLFSTLDSKKVNRHLYRIYVELYNNDKNVIYIENSETRQTNLHIAVLKQDLELAYSILEIHKQFNKNMSAVNSRDIYKKTALQYAISNVMTLFVEYLKEFGAK